MNHDADVVFGGNEGLVCLWNTGESVLVGGQSVELGWGIVELKDLSFVCLGLEDIDHLRLRFSLVIKESMEL